MFELGFVTNNEQAKELYDYYGVSYQVMKRSGEVRGKKSNRSYDFKKEIIQLLNEMDAGWVNDHVDIWESEYGSLLVASPYEGNKLTLHQMEHIEQYGYCVEDSGFYPYNGVSAIIIHKFPTFR